MVVIANPRRMSYSTPLGATRVIKTIKSIIPALNNMGSLLYVICDFHAHFCITDRGSNIEIFRFVKELSFFVSNVYTNVSEVFDLKSLSERDD